MLYNKQRMQQNQKLAQPKTSGSFHFIHLISNSVSRSFYAVNLLGILKKKKNLIRFRKSSFPQKSFVEMWLWMSEIYFI